MGEKVREIFLEAAAMTTSQLSFEDLRRNKFHNATEKDQRELSGGMQRVLNLLKDGAWHTAAEILEVAKGSEGLRRLRDLRKHGHQIEARRSADDSRMFVYRLV